MSGWPLSLCFDSVRCPPCPVSFRPVPPKTAAEGHTGGTANEGSRGAGMINVPPPRESPALVAFLPGSRCHLPFAPNGHFGSIAPLFFLWRRQRHADVVHYTDLTTAKHLYGLPRLRGPTDALLAVRPRAGSPDFGRRGHSPEAAPA